MRGQAYFEADWRREQLRTNLWLVPILQTLAIVLLFALTYTVDRAAYDGLITLPSWVLNGSADSARAVLATIAAAIITVVGIVFSITIVALTLASTQFGPRMLRNFVRDPGTQLALGTFVASFCYATISLVSVGGGPHGDFVPHLSITVTLFRRLVRSYRVRNWTDVASDIQSCKHRGAGALDVRWATGGGTNGHASCARCGMPCPSSAQF